MVLVVQLFAYNTALIGKTFVETDWKNVIFFIAIAVMHISAASANMSRRFLKAAVQKRCGS